MNGDTLSDVLNAVRLKGAVFFDVEASAPWVAEALPAKSIAGAILPEHSHIHEQVVHLYEGEFEMTVEGVTRRMSGGSVFAIPASARHHGRAITDCRVMDAFYPLRDDYRDGAKATILGEAAKTG